MRTRRAGADDVPALAALRAAWREQPCTAEFVEAFRDWFVEEGASRWWWIAEEGGEAVGMIGLKLFDRMPTPDGAQKSWGYLANLFVLPERRGTGAGTALVTALLDEADRSGLVRVVLSPSERAIPLYERLGFAPASSLLLRERP